MKRMQALTLHGLAAAALLGFAVSASAVPIALTLSEVAAKESNNPDDIQCVIYGNSCPAGIQDMSSLNYVQGMNQTSYDLTATPNQKGSGESSVVNPYTVGYIASFVTKTFDIGIDVNTAGGQPPEILDAFYVSVNGTVIYQYTGPGSLDPNFNGNGYFDFLLKTVDLSSFADSAVVTFRAVWHQATDGAENFFLVRHGPGTSVPEPGTTALILSGLSLLAMSRRRRKI